jgi:[FeFe] hydrogenase (group B1/B3)
MFAENNANRLRKEILFRVARALYAENCAEQLDRIPLVMRPKKSKSPTRCCYHKDRAVIKYRCMAALGIGVEEETDELKPISAYLRDALARCRVSGAMLTVIDEACSACVTAQYSATNACRGCVARLCDSACPKGAIYFVEGKAMIDPDRCINCGLCMKACPYHAIIRIPIPCEEACPVGAIKKNPETGREVIDPEKCISCGKCLQECPFAAISEKSHMVEVVKLLRRGRAIALLAPSFCGQFPGTMGQLVTAMRRLGFVEVLEVAGGAEQTTVAEGAEWGERMASGARFMTTSCCPAYIEAVERHLPEMKPFVSHTATPMAYSAATARAQFSGCSTVFIGPCIAKRVEGARNADVDAVLTFEELGALLVGAGVDVLDCEEAAVEHPAHREGRGFAASGGVTDAVAAFVPQGEEIKPLLVDGLDRKVLKQMKFWADKSCPGNFVEVMSCAGGCIAGPGAVASPRVTRGALKQLLDGSEPAPREVEEGEIR